MKACKCLFDLSWWLIGSVYSASRFNIFYFNVYAADFKEPYGYIRLANQQYLIKKINVEQN